MPIFCIVFSDSPYHGRGEFYWLISQLYLSIGLLYLSIDLLYLVDWSAISVDWSAISVDWSAISVDWSAISVDRSAISVDRSAISVDVRLCPLQKKHDNKHNCHLNLPPQGKLFELEFLSWNTDSYY